MEKLVNNKCECESDYETTYCDCLENFQKEAKKLLDSTDESWAEGRP